MADDEVVLNGGDRTLEISGNEDLEEPFVDANEADPKVLKLMQKIEVLETENNELVHENDVVKDRINKLKGEIDALDSDKADLKREIERSVADMKSLESVAARAAELEIEVSRLQHDLITAMADGEEANREAIELKAEVEKLKEIDLKKGENLDVFEKERVLLLAKVDKLENELTEEKEVGKERVRVLETKLKGLEGGDSGGNLMIDEKESEIRKLKKSIDDLDAVIVRNSAEMGKIMKDREELENAKSGLEVLLKKSEERVKEMEEKMGHLHKELEVSEQVIRGFKDKTFDGINGIPVIDDGEKGSFGLKLQWPVLAASTGVIFTMGALCYLRARQR